MTSSSRANVCSSFYFAPFHPVANPFPPRFTLFVPGLFYLVVDVSPGSFHRNCPLPLFAPAALFLVRPQKLRARLDFDPFANSPREIARIPVFTGSYRSTRRFRSLLRTCSILSAYGDTVRANCRDACGVQRKRRDFPIRSERRIELTNLENQ